MCSNFISRRDPFLDRIICLADIYKLTATIMRHCDITITQNIPDTISIHIGALDKPNTKMNQRRRTSCSRIEENHSSDIEEIHEPTDLDKCRINNENDCRYEYERRCSTAAGDGRCELHKKGDIYGKESIVRTRVESGLYSDIKRAADLKFKCSRDGRCVEPIGRTMGDRVLVVVVTGLFLAMLTTCAAAPARNRPTRGAHHEKSARSYLETFGYLKKGRPEVGNLLMGDEAQNYEDDFRIAIKTLQEFGGISVTGEIDEDTIHLMKQRRCGRPDREEGDEENGHRRKRFAIQGSKWEHTNLTWSLSQDRRPSQLDPHGTRSVLARALDVWEQASRLTFTEINSDKADIVVSFAKRYHDDAYPFDGRGSILAHAFFPGSGRGGDAHFDDDELWLLQPKNEDEEGTSLFAVAAHEFGHSLGLSHSSVRGALMFPWYQGIQPNFVLPEDDRNGIQQMYGPKESSKKWGRIPYYRPPETPPPTTSTTTTTTTTRRPIHRHNHRHQYPYRPSYTPSNPREPSKNPTYYPEKRYPNLPSYPERPYYPTRRHYNVSEEYPRRTNPNHYPRPTETTTTPTTYRPRYPVVRPEYPNNRPNYPTDPRPDYPKKPYYPEKTTTRPTPTTSPDVPEACDTSYDAVALIRNELFIFKGKYHWRIGARGRYDGYPMEIRRMWSGLPKDLTHVDAVYERPDQNIAIFIGKRLYLFNIRELLPGYPKPLASLGLPQSLEKLDAAMVWGHNTKTYFYSGTMYWKFDEDEGRVELDYPRNMAMWKGVGYNIDSVFQWKDGKTYFFKGKGFWKFNDLQMRVEHEKQLPSAQFWMGCPAERPGTRSPYRALPAPGSTLRSPSSSSRKQISSLLLPFFTSVILVGLVRKNSL